MPQPKFQVYKHIKINGKWRYCRAAIYSNGKVNPHVVVVAGQKLKPGMVITMHKRRLVDGRPVLRSHHSDV